MTTVRSAVLEQVRFGEFLLERARITDEQWLAALADHWSGATVGHFRKIGRTIADSGFLELEVVEAEAQIFHDGIEVVEITDRTPRSELPTVPPPHRS